MKHIENIDDIIEISKEEEGIICRNAADYVSSTPITSSFHEIIGVYDGRSEAPDYICYGVIISTIKKDNGEITGNGEYLRVLIDDMPSTDYDCLRIVSVLLAGEPTNPQGMSSFRIGDVISFRIKDAKLSISEPLRCNFIIEEVRLIKHLQRWQLCDLLMEYRVSNSAPCTEAVLCLNFDQSVFESCGNGRIDSSQIKDLLMDESGQYSYSGLVSIVDAEKIKIYSNQGRTFISFYSSPVGDDHDSVPSTPYDSLEVIGENYTGRSIELNNAYIIVSIRSYPDEDGFFPIVVESIISYIKAERVNDLLLESIQRMLIEDGDLLSNNSFVDIVNERTLMFRLGHYLQNLLPGYDVDCEYNRHINNIKTLDGGNVLPDIVIHRRRSDDDNIAWIEIKKFSARPNDIEQDRRRLILVTDPNREYFYRFGFLLIIKPENNGSVIVEIYENGRMCRTLHRSI